MQLHYVVEPPSAVSTVRSYQSHRPAGLLLKMRRSMAVMVFRLLPMSITSALREGAEDSEGPRNGTLDHYRSGVSSGDG